MSKLIRVKATTPLGDYQEYYWYGDISEDRLAKFMNECASDTADKFYAPEDWDVKNWLDNTSVIYEEVD